MMSLLLFFSPLSVSAENSGQDGTVRVLFIGGSPTDANNMPLLFQSIARSKGKSVIVDYSTLVAPSLGGLLEKKGYREALNGTHYSDHWDYVVLQENSAVYRDTSSVQNVGQSYRAIRSLRAGIAKAGAKTLLYLPPLSGTGRTPEENIADQKRADWYSVNIASEIGAGVIPAGSVVAEAAAVFGFQPFAEGDKRPSVTASYITACAFYAAIFGESPEGANHQTLDQTEQKDQWRQIQAMTFQRVSGYYASDGGFPRLAPADSSGGSGSAAFRLFQKEFVQSPEMAAGYLTIALLLLLTVFVWTKLLLRGIGGGNRRERLPGGLLAAGTAGIVLLMLVAAASPVPQLALRADAVGEHLLYFLEEFVVYAGFGGLAVLFAYGFGGSLKGKTYLKLLWADFALVSLIVLRCAAPFFRDWIAQGRVTSRTDAVLFAAGFGLALAALAGALWRRHRQRRTPYASPLQEGSPV